MMARQLLSLWALASVLLLAGCDDPNALQGTPVSQTLSPNGRIVVLVTRYSGNATVSFADRVYMKPLGGNSGDVQLILKADKASNVTVEWVDDRHLQIDVPCAQIFSYKNFFYLMNSGELVYPVSIALINRGLCSV